MKILSVIGTRPEAIKMAPVIRALEARADVVSRVAITAQHRQMLDEALALFAIHPDHDLDLMREGQSPSAVAAAVLAGLEPVIAAEQPDWLVVQGDTTTTLAAAIAGFYAGVRVAHVEAGLRTGDLADPFPEEGNRSLVGRIASLHCAATPRARDALLSEGVPAARIRVTGNPVIDALQWIVEQPHRQPAVPPPADGIRRVVVTVHRRESFGAGLRGICAAITSLVERLGPEIEVVLPVHPNPAVRQTVEAALGQRAGIRLVPPMRYVDFVMLLRDAFLILTDSGGVQEEAPSLGKPVLVLRRCTERTEAIDAGAARLVGVEPQTIVDHVRALWHDVDAYEAMAQAVNPFGDGHAADRIVGHLVGESPADFHP